jgi:hypothetical protein
MAFAGRLGYTLWVIVLYIVLLGLVGNGLQGLAAGRLLAAIPLALGLAGIIYRHRKSLF